jgi:tetratricopeptide (TPR) repeat protein
MNEIKRAMVYYEQALAIDREIGNQPGVGATLSNLGVIYAVLGDVLRAIEYYEQAIEIARKVGDRKLEANILGNLGNTYKNLGDAHRAIQHYEQAQDLMREIEDIAGVATVSFNVAILYAQQGETARALPLAQEAAHIYTQIGHAQYAQRARQLVAQLQRGETVSSGLSPDQILQQFAQVIEAVVAAAHGNRQARAAVEEALPQLKRNGWRITDPIQRIWQGERDETALTAGIDSNSALIIREILKQLEN